MTLKRILLIILMLVTLILGAQTLIGCVMEGKEVASMSKHTTEPYTADHASVSFQGEVGDKIEYRVRTDAKAGTAEFAVFNEDGEPVSDWADWCTADDLKYSFIVDKAQEYEFCVKYTDFVGSFKAVVVQSAQE